MKVFAQSVAAIAAAILSGCSGDAGTPGSACDSPAPVGAARRAARPGSAGILPAMGDAARPGSAGFQPAMGAAARPGSAGILPAANVSIRALGRVEAAFAEFPDGGAEIRYLCESPEAAATLVAKRRRDLLSFGGLRETADGAIALDGVGTWRIEVHIEVHGFTVSETFSHVQGGGELQFASSANGGLETAAPLNLSNGHPVWLDGFDRCGASMWVGGGGTPMDVPGDFEWLSRLGLAMCVALPGGEEDCFAPGEMDWSQYDWYEAVARRYGLPFRMLTHVGRFEWCWGSDPLPHVFPGDPRYVGLPAFYYIDVLTTGAMNAGVPGVPSDRYRFDARRRLAERFNRPDSPLLGWHVCEELTCGTLNWLASCAATPSVVAEWRAYARDVLGVSGDPGPVPVPEDFLPRDPERDIDLFGEWEISTDGGARWRRGPCNDAILLAFSKSWHVKPPDRYRDVLLRRSFEVPRGGLAAARHLHIASAAYKTVYGAPPDVTVNGVRCERLPGDFSRCYDLGPALREGRNEILVNAHGSCLPGYVYLTARPLALYPDMGDALNRRWFDAVNFASHLRVRYIEDRIRAVRAADPVRPLKMMAVKEAQDEALDLCRRYGAYFHDTGAAGAYWCPYTGARLSKSHGLPWSCEQGGPPKDVAAMRAAASRYLQYGNDAADLVFAIGDYRSKNPEVAAWCETNAALLRAIGQLRMPLPRVAVLRSSRVTRLSPEMARDVEVRDVGRGLLQALGRDFVYAEIPDLHEPGFLGRFPVVVDCATAVMEARDAAAIRRYVERGGTFVAMPMTGLHLPERRGAAPLDAAFADAAPDVRARFVRLSSWPSMKDVSGAYSPDGADAAGLASALRRAAGAPDWESGDPRFWASPRESKNGVFDVVVATRMENPGDGVEPEVEAAANVRLAASAQGGGELQFASVSGTFAPMQTRLFTYPKADPARAGLRWLSALAEIWHPVEAVDPISAAPVVEPSPDVVVLRDGWSPCAPGFFGALGMPEDSVVAFATSAQVPREWLDAGDSVDLVMHCGFAMRGLSPWGRVTVNGRGVPGLDPFKGFRQGGQFSFDATAAAREGGGRLEIRIEIDGTKSASDPVKFGGRPNGAGATFALHRRRAAVASRPLERWIACVDYADETPVAPGEAAPHRWYETRFPTPEAVAVCAPSRRLFIAADRPLRGIMLNGRALNVPDLMREIDVTGLLLPGAGAENVLRWCDGDLHGFHADRSDRVFSSPLGKMELRLKEPR